MWRSQEVQSIVTIQRAVRVADVKDILAEKPFEL
jgi:hypothetical protein